MSDYLSELNESQRAAVVYNDGPSLVIAGAGSGKTRVLTYKIAYLLDHGYQPWNILALTFTNKAAREMKSRISRQVGEQRAHYLWMGTFHSIFLRILHTEHEAIGFSSQFTVYDTADSKSLIKSIIKAWSLDDKVYKPGSVQTQISNAKNRLILPKDYMNNAAIQSADAKNRMPRLGEIYSEYCARCRQADAMDFDDLLLHTYLLFRSRPDILTKYQDRFRYILVDEYQDTNFAQHSIVLQLAGQHRHVCVVGDDAQSIYSFRGAEIDNILHFTKMFQGAKVFKLEQNYRSTQTIVGAANSLIDKNKFQIKKDVYSRKEKGDSIAVMRATSDVEEGELVAGRIASMHVRQGLPYSAFAILYRTNAQSRIFEETMRKRGIPYRVYGGLSFYQRKEIKDVIAYFRMAVNPNDEEAFKRTVNYPARGIGETTVNKIIDAASRSRTSLWNVINDPASTGLNVSKGTLNKLDVYRNLIQGFNDKVTAMTAAELGPEIIKQSGIAKEILQDNSPEGQSRMENIDELTNGLESFTDERREEGDTNVLLTDYLSDVSLLTDQDTDKDADASRVTIMTIHSAKGLEFNTVFVVGMEEGLFPSLRTDSSNVTAATRELEEERRLFYVAITRAEEHCFLTYAKMRFRYGKMEFSSPSRFLNDIDPTYLDVEDIEDGTGYRGTTAPRQSSWQATRQQYTPRPQTPRPQQHPVSSSAASSTPANTAPRMLKKVGSPLLSPSSGNSDGTSALSVGQTIEHQRFGIGTVLSVEGTGDDTRATIQFRNAGVKKLLLRFARFKVIS